MIFEWHELFAGVEDDSSGEALPSGVGEFPQAVEVALGDACAGLHFDTDDPLTWRFEHQVVKSPRIMSDNLGWVMPEIGVAVAGTSLHVDFATTRLSILHTLSRKRRAAPKFP